MKNRLTIVAVCLTVAIVCVCDGAQERPAKTLQKSVTVYPVGFTSSANVNETIPVRVAEVIGTLLERAGMEHIEIGDKPFSPPETDDAEKLANAFGQFIGQQSLKTEYALYGQILGTRESGITIVRTIVVDKTGNVVFVDTANKAVFSRAKVQPKDPMTASVFLANRLGDVWDLADPLRKDAPTGKMADVMRKRSGAPSEKQLAAMNNRLAALKGKFANSKVTVYPVHLWKGSDSASASRIAELLNKQGICQAQASKADLKLKIQGDPNQQKVLWDTARAFRKYLNENPPKTELALLADFGLSPSADGKRTAHHVHVILCNRSGDWVIVDFQNSHHRDFQSINPKTCEECSRLAIVRLKNRLSK